MEVPTRVDRLMPLRTNRPDSAFVVFASPEPRCLGIAQQFAEYQAERICVLTICDEPNANRDGNIQHLKNATAHAGTFTPFEVKHSDPVFGIAELAAALNVPDGHITIDISTFPRISLLLALRAIEHVVRPSRLRVLYSEPESYDDTASNSGRPGFKGTTVVPSFIAPYTPKEELVLIIFLGFERDRALGVWQSVEPHRTIAVIGSPGYQDGYELRSRTVNASLIASLERRNLHRVDAKNPRATYEFLRKVILDGEWPDGTNFYIAPLGTKPQTVGTYCFCRDFPDEATVVHSSHLEHARQYIARGIGPSWNLPYIEAK